ncbi:MAG: DUF3307 domain-containing protein [Firmicutes bacterium]|nr:DUF3307 domain-containing protein [Bacillota bacterium]
MNLVLVILLLAHVLGDFYFQTDKLAARKGKIAGVLLHGAEYALTVCVILLIGLPFRGRTWLLIGAASILHLGIDSAKVMFGKKLKASILFLLDQFLHLASLLLIFWLWGAALTARGFVSTEIAYLPALPVTILLGLLLALRPVGMWIGKGKGEKNAGQTIGYLERVLILLFLLYRQFTAIAFVLTAKSVARYDAISKERIRAEDFLIGTLKSSAAAFLIALLLGLIGKGT